MNIDRSIALAIAALVVGVAVALAPFYMTINNIGRDADTTTYIKQLPQESTKEIQNILDYLRKSKNIYEIISAPYRILTSLPGAPVSAPAFAATEALISTTASKKRVSETNVQVAGVDELDIVKTDGRFIAVASSSNVYIVDVETKEVLSAVELRSYAQGLFLFDNTLVVVSQNPVARTTVIDTGTQINIVIPRTTPNTVIDIIDIADPKKPRARLSLNITGYVVGARRINDYVYLVLDQEIDYNLIDDRTLVLPIVNGAPIDLDKVHKVDSTPTSYINIVIIDLGKLMYNVETFLVNRGSRIYMTSTRLYIASDEIQYHAVVRKIVEEAINLMPKGDANDIYEDAKLGRIDEAYRKITKYLTNISREDREAFVNKINSILSSLDIELTHVYVFSVDKLSISLEGVIRAPGHLLDQFAIEEYNNMLVLATTVSNLRPKLAVIEYTEFTESTTDSEEYIVVVEWSKGEHKEKTIKIPREERSLRVLTRTHIVLTVELNDTSDNRVYIYDTRSLELVGKLEGLAKGERIYAARIIKNILFLVTFRQIDPLFAIDIGNAKSPKVLGYLKIPGFSEYLHPLPNDMLLGIGLENTSLKVSVFDVKDPVNMRETSKIYITTRYSVYSEALYDHKAVTVDLDSGRVYLPISISAPTKVFDGIAVVQIEDDILRLVSILDHEAARRAIYVGDELFTISPNSIKVYNYWTLEQIKEIVLEKLG